MHKQWNYKLNNFKDEQNCLLMERSEGNSERSDNVQQSSVSAAVGSFRLRSKAPSENFN